MNVNGDYPKSYAGVGQESAPSFTFGAEPVTGVYLDTPGTSSAYTISKRGTKRLRIDDTKTTIYGPLVADGFAPSGGVTLPDGSESAPSLNFASSTGSGLYMSTNGSLTVTSAGERRMSWNPTPGQGTFITTALTVGSSTLGLVSSKSFAALTDGAYNDCSFRFNSDAKVGLFKSGSSLCLHSGTSSTPNLDVSPSLFTVNTDMYAPAIESGELNIANGGAGGPVINFENVVGGSTGIYYNPTLPDTGITFEEQGSKVFSMNNLQVKTHRPFTTGTYSATTGNLTSNSILALGTLGVAGSTDVQSLVVNNILTQTGTGSTSTTHLSASDFTLNGTMNMFNNSMTCGAISSTSVTSSGAITAGTNGLTGGSASVTSLTSTGTVSCGTNAMTCGALTTSGSISTTGNIGNTTGFSALYCLVPLTAITADTSNSQTVSRRKYLLNAISADRKLTLSTAPSTGHQTGVKINATSAFNWTISSGTGANIIVRAFASNLIAPVYTPSTAYTNIILGPTSAVGDYVNLTFTGTQWFAEVFVALNTSVTFS